MKTRWMVITLGLAMLLTVKGFSAGKEEGKKFSATCPVSGKPAIESSSVETKNGDKIYFCCENCPKAYEKDPKKYANKANAQLLETAQIAEVACPLTGKPLNKDAKAKVGEVEVAFCCEKCLAKFNAADDEGKLKMAFSNAALKKGYTHQTTCPVSGKEIDASHSVEYKGEKVYFCCPNCPKAFEADPEKFVAKLPQFAKGKKKAEAN